MSPRRPRVAGHSRQQIAHRLRDRRSHEETLILDAAEALARRNAAEMAMAEASEALTGALDELQRLGFEVSQVAELLDVESAELLGPGNSRRVASRTSRPGKGADATSGDEISIPDSTE
jgi:hypothetical protein